MPATLEQLKRRFHKTCKLYAGADGEEFARRWLRANGWTWDNVDQTPENICDALKSRGGKRPDFVAEADADYYLLLDAKYHATEGCKTFKLRIDELAQYRIANDYIVELFSPTYPKLLIETWFLVFPKEYDGTRVVFIELSEMEGGRMTTFPDGAPAKCVSLENRSEWWADNPE